MSHHIPNLKQILTVFLRKGLPVSLVLVWALPRLPFRFPRVCLCNSKREANWKWAWPPDASEQSLSHLTHTHSCASLDSCTYIISHRCFFPSTPPFPFSSFHPHHLFKPNKKDVNTVCQWGSGMPQRLTQALALSDRQTALCLTALWVSQPGWWSHPGMDDCVEGILRSRLTVPVNLM